MTKQEKPSEKCNRTACKQPHEGFWNPSTRAYYCQKCANAINEGMTYPLLVIHPNNMPDTIAQSVDDAEVADIDYDGSPITWKQLAERYKLEWDAAEQEIKIIRAATSKVEEVTYWDFENEMEDVTNRDNGKIVSEFLMTRFPNGLRIVKEKE